MNKTVILKDRNGNNIYPKVPYTNVFGIPHPINEDINIFYGDGTPVTSPQSTYENIKVHDIYVNTLDTNRDTMFYRCKALYSGPPGGGIVWDSDVKYVIKTGQPPTLRTGWNTAFSNTAPTLKKGFIWYDDETNDIYVVVDFNSSTITWQCLTEKELPESSSSDAGKILTVDQNGDPGWENKEPRYELLGTYDMSQNPTGFTFDATNNVDDFLIVCENILSTENGKRLSFRMPMDSVSIAPNTDYAISNVTPRNFYIKHERINENLYETMIGGDLLAATRNIQINNYYNTTSYSSKLKRIQVQVATGTGSAIASGTIKIYGRIRF